MNKIEEIFFQWANDDPWLFATTVILVIAIEGLVLGILFSYISRLLGIEVPEGGGH